MSVETFVLSHVLFNDLSQTKPARFFDFRESSDFHQHRIRGSISMSIDNASDIANNLNMFLTRKCMKNTLLLLLVVPDHNLPVDLLNHYEQFLKNVETCQDEDNVWSQVKSIRFVNYDLFFSTYGKCDTIFEGESIVVKLKGRIKEFPSEIIPNFMFLGNYCDGTDPMVLLSLGITHIVDVSGEYMSRDCAGQHNIEYLPILIWDNSGVDIAIHFDTVISFIESCKSMKGGKILIHCRAGISRSATFVLAYLLHSRLVVDLKEALNVVLEQRPYICPNDSFRAQLREYESQFVGCQSFNTDKDMMQFISSKNCMWAGIYSTESDFDRIPITAGKSFNSIGVPILSEYPEEGEQSKETVATSTARPKRPFLKKGHGKPTTIATVPVGTKASTVFKSQSMVNSVVYIGGGSI